MTFSSLNIPYLSFMLPYCPIVSPYLFGGFRTCVERLIFNLGRSEWIIDWLDSQFCDVLSRNTEEFSLEIVLYNEPLFWIWYPGSTVQELSNHDLCLLVSEEVNDNVSPYPICSTELLRWVLWSSVLNIITFIL